MDFTLVGLWHEMGLLARGVVVVLLAMSLYSLGITGERILTYRKGRRLSRLYIDKLARLIESARLRDALGLDKTYVGGPVATVVGSGVSEYARSVDAGVKGTTASAFDVAEAVNRTMERVKERELAGLRRGLPVLATVASSAPFVGLFGTVWGIMGAFRDIYAAGNANLATVARPISEALVATAVAISASLIGRATVARFAFPAA